MDCFICNGEGFVNKDLEGNVLQKPEKCICKDGKVDPSFGISKYLLQGHLKKSKNGELGGSLDSAFFQQVCQNSIYMLELLEQAADEIERCNDGETDLVKRIRDIL